MTDLETRIREGLDSPPAWRFPDDLLDDVRRGARHRRTRRATGLVAAAALVLATAGGGLAWHHRELQTAHPAPGNLPVGTFAVSVTGAGQIFKVVSNQDCVSPCSTVWKRVGNHWAKLATFRSDQSPIEVVIRHIAMAPDGRNGWAWGAYLYATHDGGATWARITGGPATRPGGIEDLQVGQTQAWATSQTDATGRTLWHTPVDSDDWSQVQPPSVRMLGEGRVPPKHWFMNSVLPDGRVDLLLGPFPHHVYDTVGGEHGWIRQTVRCAPLPRLLGGRIQDPRVCGPSGPENGRSGYVVPLKYSSVQVAVHPGSPSAPVGDADVLYASQHHAVIATHSGVLGSDLRLGQDDQIVDSSDSGGHVVILTRGHRIFLSNDSGRHWTQVEP